MSYPCAKYEGKKVVITYDSRYKKGEQGVIVKERNTKYSHVIVSSKGENLLYISDLPEHKKYSWKPAKLKLG